jgi:hypothetical protein
VSAEKANNRVATLLAEAQRLMALQRSEQAVPLLNEALKLDPWNSELRLQVGSFALRQGSHKQALRHFEICVAEDPGKSAVWLQIGSCHMLAGRHVEAAQAYAQARQGNGDAGAPSWRYARALRLSGQTAQAAQEIQATVALPNAETAAYHECAQLCMELGKRNDAERIWRRLAALGSKSLVGACARARLAMLDDPPVTAPDAKRVAFHLKSAFHEAIITPGYMACRSSHHVLVSHDAEELVAFDPDVIVACDSHLAAMKTLMPRAITVQTRHGMGSKGHAPLLAQTCDYLCLSHQRQEGFFTGRGVRPARGFWPIGYLQLDPLLNGSLAPAALPGKPWMRSVLFAPTIGESVSALGMLGDDPVAALRPDAEAFMLVIKAHPETAMRHPDWWARLSASARRHANVVLVNDPMADIMPYVAACDLMVTDVSSVMFFAAAVDMPLVLLSNPARHSHPERFDPEGPEWRWRNMGEEVEDAADLPSAIAAVLASPERHGAARQACRDDMLGDLTDGRAGERLSRRIAALAPGG